MTRGETLLAIARGTLEEAFGGPKVPRDPSATWLDEKRAVFVTLTRHGELRGCVGQLEARLTLWDAVREAARAAAFRDHRFPRLSQEELPDLRLEISVLSPVERLGELSEEETLSRLRPGVDGVVLTNGHRSGVFIPEVWKDLPAPADFLAHLKRKAGLPVDQWLPGTSVERFTAEVFHEPGGRHHADDLPSDPG